MKKCRRCNHMNKDSAHFCCNCGKKFDTTHIADQSDPGHKPRTPDFLRL